MIRAWTVFPAIIVLAVGTVVAFAQVHPRLYVIDQKNNAFVPQRLVVPRGATVVFANHDATEHNVTLALPQGVETLTKDLGTFPPEEKVSYTFEHSGIVRVHCKIHPEMTATIVVR